MNNPKRRKSKDNPYTLIYNSQDDKYIISFNDSSNHKIIFEIDRSLYMLFNEFELEDLSELNEFDRHIEHLNIMESDEILYKRTLKKSLLVDDIVDKKLEMETLREAINELPIMQKRRLKKYYFENKTLEDIAKDEHCSKVAVKYSIDCAISNLRKKLKS